MYAAIRLDEADGRLILEAELRPRAKCRPRCSQCHRPGPGYDTLAPRRFEFVPLWGIPVFFVYAVRRVHCERCGVRVEAIPWAEGKHQLTTTYAWFLAGWARRLSWTAVAAAFDTTWDHVFRAVAMAVQWGLAHRDLTGITAIGIDELARRRGPRYVTLVYPLDPGCRRLLWMGRDRTTRRCWASSAGWGASAPPPCASCAATCGSPTCGSWPRRPATRSTCWIASTSWST